MKGIYSFFNASKVALIVLFLSFFGKAYAQFDTEFWLPPLWEVGVSSRNQPSNLFITTPFDFPVSVHIETTDGTTFVFDGTVVSGTPLTVALSTTLGQTNIAGVANSNRGLRVTSSAPIQCVHRVAGTENQTLVTLKGKNALGKDFWCGSQVRNLNANYGTQEFHFISVMAMENNTSVTFTTPFTMYSGSGALSNPHSVTLQAGESYLIRGNSPVQHVCGSHVVSNKDIAVVSGSTHTRISGTGANAADGGTDQLVPLELAGNEWVLIKGNNNNPWDYGIVVATQNNTNIYIDGSATPTATINAGQYYDWTMTGAYGAPHYFRTDRPAFMYHISGCSLDEEVDMSAMPEISCTGSRYIEFSKFNISGLNEIMPVLIPPTAEPTMKFNGVDYDAVAGVIINNVPGLPGWKVATFPNSVVALNNILTSEGFFHAAWLTGNGSTGAYGYLSGFDDAFEFQDPTSADPIPTTIYQAGTLCQGQSIDHCIEVYSCGDNHFIDSFSGNEGTVVVAPPSAPSDTCFRYTAPFNFTGNDTITFIVENEFGFQGSIDIVFTVLNPNTPINAGADQFVCGVSTATLSAVNPDPLVDGFWTVVAGTGVIADPNSPTTTVSNLSLGPNANSFIWHQNYGSCGVNNADLVQISRYTGTPPTANAGIDANLCSGNTFTMAANSAGVSATGTWSITSGTATIVNINSNNTLVTNLAIGVNTFVWNIANGPCPGGETSDAMVINVFNASHPAANAGADQVACQGSFTTLTLTGSTPQIPATGLWTVVAGSGTFGSATSPTTTVSGLSIGTNTFQWTINNGPCGTLTDQVTIVVYSPSSPIANAGPDQTVCLPNNSATLAGNTPTAPATGTWSVIAGSGSFSNVNSPTSTVSGLSVGTNTFRWTLSNGPCSGSVTTDNVTIIVYPENQPAPNAGPDQSFCFTSTPVVATLAANSPTAPGTGLWTVVSGSGTFSNASSPTSTVSGLSLGNNVFQWSLNNGSCDSPVTDQMIVTVYNGNLSTANAGPDGSICAPLSTYNLQGTAPALPATGLWSQVSGPGGASINNPSSPTSQITNLTSGVYVFRWTIQNGTCGNTVFDEMTLNVFNAAAQVSNAGPDQQFCFSGISVVNATMAANAAVAPTTGTWTLISGGGTITNPSSATTTITNLPVGINIFRWTLNSGVCGSSNDLVAIYVFSSTQSAANAGPDQSICSNAASVTLAGSNVITPATGTWSVVSGPSTLSFTSTSSPTAQVSGFVAGVYTLQWTVNNGPCGTPAILNDQMTITVYSASQSPASAGADQSICNTTSIVNLGANSPTFPAVGTWTVASGSGTFSNSNSPVSTVSGLSVGTNCFTWTINNGACGAPTTDQICVTVFDTNAPIANAGADQSFCLPTTSATLAANTPSFPSTGSWSLINGSGTFANSTSPTSGVSGLSLGTNTFRWTINNGSCGTITTDDVVITIFNNNLTVPSAGPDAELCTPTSTYTMQGSAVSLPATGVWTLVSGTGTIANTGSPTTNISGLGIGANIFRWTILNGPCPAGQDFDEMTIFVFDENQVNANAGPDQELCFNGTVPANATMAASAVVFPGAGSWSIIQGSGTIVSSTSPTTQITNLGIGQNIFRWTVDNGPCANANTFDDVSIFVFSGAQAPAFAGADQELCSTNPSTTLAGNSVIFPGSGLWTVVQGTAVFADATNPTTTVSGLATGTNVLQWTISNGPCSPSNTSDQVTITVFNNAQNAANAGADFTACTSQPSVTFIGNTFSAPATGLWQITSGSGTIVSPTSSTTAVTGLGVGTNILSYTIFNGPCAPSTVDNITVTVYSAAQTAANAGANQNICLPTNSTTLTANALISPATGVWTLVSGVGTITSPNSPTTTVTGLGIGENIFQWTISNGPCSPTQTTDQVSIIIFDNNQPAANAGTDQSFCEPVSSATLSGNAAPFPASGVWTWVSGPVTPTIVSPSNSTTQVTGLGVGANVFRWTISNGPCAPATTFDEVTILIYDIDQPAANAGPDQFLCSPTFNTQLAANNAFFPATGTWTLISGSGTIANPTSSASLVSGLAVGENIFRWTISNGPCSGSLTTNDVSIFVFDSNAPAANAGADQSICSPASSVTMAANSAIFPGVGTWTLVSGSGSITSPNSPNSLITNLGIGENIFQWSINNGACGTQTTTDLVSIFVYSEFNLNANAGPDQDLCTPITSATLDGSEVIFPASGVWTLVSSAGSPTITDPTNPNTTVTGLAIGPNVFEWTVLNGPCANGLTTDQVTITIFDGGAATPFAGNEQELCSPTTTTFLGADAAVFPGIGTWTLISGTGTPVSPNDEGTEITGLSIGVNVFRWSVDYSTCGSPFDDVEVIVYDSTQPQADAGVDQQLCTPTTSTNFAAGAVISPGFGTWELIQGTGAIANVNDPNSLVTNLSLGENIFQWTVYNGACLDVTLQTDQVSIWVFSEENPNADAGEDQELCTPTSSTTLTGSDLIYPATGLWTIVSGSGTITNPTSSTTTITGLTVGETVVDWTVNNGPCPNTITSDQVTILMYDQNQGDADAGEDQFLCTPTTSTNLVGNPITFPAIGTWTLIAGTGTIADIHDPNTAITGLSIGQNTFQWSIDNGPCANGNTTDVVNIFVYDANNPIANAGADQEICLPLDAVSMSGSQYTFPATGVWTIIQGSGTITNPNDPQTTITDLAVGVNIIQWTVDNGPCASAITIDQVEIRVFDPSSPDADAGADQEICEPASSTFLNAADPIIPGYGTWSILSGSPTASFANVNDPNSEITGLTVGETVLLWTVYNGPCDNTGSFDLVSIFIFESTQLDADAGEDQNICTPQSTANLEGNSVTFPAVGTWVLQSGAGTIVDPNDPNSLVTDLEVGANVFCWTIDNGPCGTTTDCITINVYDEEQPAANAGDDQEFCLPTNSTTLFGSAIVGSSIGQWSVIAGGGTIMDISSPTPDVLFLPQGENIFRWTVDNGSCGTTMDEVSVFIYNNDAPEADAGEDVSFCTPVSTYIMDANTPETPGVGTWEIVSGPNFTSTGTIDDVNNPNANISGLVVGENVFSWTIYNGPCEQPTVDLISIFIYDENLEDANAGEDQEICLPQTAVNMTANAPVFPAFGEWTLIQGGGDIADINDPLTLVSNLPVGENIFQWTFHNGPCDDAITSDLVSIFVFDPDAAVANAGQDQSFCEPVSSTNLSATTPDVPGVGTWTLVGGTGTIADVNDPNTLITDLTVGENCFLWTVYNGPCEDPTEDVMCIYIYPSDQQPANAGADQEMCTPNTDTQMSANAATYPAIGSWTLISGSGDIEDIFDPNSVITNLGEGVNEFMWAIDNGSCDNPLSTDIVTLSVFNNEMAPANAGEDQELCLPQNSTTVVGSEIIAAATGVWYNIDGGGNIADPTSPTTSITDLPIGNNVFVWSVYNGPCGSSTDTLTIAVFNPAEITADAGPDASYCTPSNTHCLTGSVPSEPAVGTWTLITGTGTIENPNDPNSCITGLTVGENIFMYCIDNGPCGFTCDVMSIFVYNENTPNANAGEDIEICLPLTEVNMNASSAEFPAIGEWTLTQGSGVINDLNSPTGLMSSLGLGTNIFVWTVDNGVCPNGITTDTVEVRVFDPEAENPNAGPDQSICTPQNAVVMSANAAQDPGYGFWTLVNGSGTIVEENNPLTAITDLAVGINVFTWSFYNSNCDNGFPTDTVRILVYDESQLPADAGIDQEFCFPTNSTTLVGNELTIPAEGLWTLYQGTAVISDPTSATTDVSGLSVGTNIFVWTVSNGPCENSLTTDTMEVRIFAPDAPVANAGQDLALCTPVDCITLDATPVLDPQTGTWTYISSVNGNGSIPFGSVDDLNDPNASLCALAVGVHTLEWSIYNGPCNNDSADEVVISVYDNTAPAANAGEDVYVCSPSESVTLAANAAVFPGFGTWSITSAQGANGPLTSGTFADMNDPLTTISGLEIGIYTLTWTISNGPCGNTTDTMIIQVNDPASPNASAGPDQWFCENLTDATMAGNVPLFPAVGTWTAISFDPTGTVVDANNPTTEISNIPLNEHLFVWTIDNGACANGITSDTISVYVNDITIAAAYAGEDLSFCGAPDSLIMTASVAVGLAEGYWTYNDDIFDFTDSTFHNSIVYGFPLGVTTFTWTVDNGACGISSDDITFTVYDPELPAAYAGENQIICDHDFTPFNLNATAVDQPATAWWTILEGPIELGDTTMADSYVSTIGEILVPLVDVGNNILWTVNNGACGTTTDTLTFILEDCLTIEIPDAFSPNGDGVNDIFYIPNLESYPNHSLKIFNRWGTQVFEAAPYMNDWDGKSYHAATIGEDLPVSTYYYILDLGNGENAFTGFVYLKR